MADPSPLPTAVLTSLNAMKVADLESIRADLLYVKACANNLARLSHETMEVQRAIFESAAISYRRGFASGKGFGGQQRKRLHIEDAWVPQDQALRELHNVLTEVANRHIAHRVNDAQQMRVTAILTQDGEVAFGVVHAHLVLPDLFLPRAHALVDAILSAVEYNLANGYAALITRFEGKTPEQLREMFTPKA